MGILPAMLTWLCAASPPPQTERFLNGSTWVQAQRIGTSASGRSIVFLEPGTLRATAEVGHEAIAELHAESPVELIRIRPLWPERKLWLVRSTRNGEDGLALAARLSREHSVAWATPDFFLERALTSFPVPPDDPRYAGQWYLKRANVEGAWALTAGDPSVVIGIVDNGCDATHPDLLPNLLPGRDVVDKDDDPSPNATTRNANHGTACAGLVAARGNNGLGISGVCPLCRIRCIRMLAERGQSVPVSADVDAMRAALMLDVAVVSNSWGYVNAIPVPQALAIAIEEVATKGRGGRGAIVLFAAGNDNRELLANELYSLPFVVTVGGVNPFDEVAAFSNRGTALDLVAPTGTLTTDLVGSAGEDPSDYTSLFGGTSAACPVAAGVAGLVVSVALDAGRSDVESWLIGTTRRAPFARAPTGQDLEYGYGIIDAKAAVERAMGTPPTTDAGTIPLAPDENEPTRGCGCGLSSGCGLWALAVCLRRRHRSA